MCIVFGIQVELLYLLCLIIDKIVLIDGYPFAPNEIIKSNVKRVRFLEMCPKT
jgi:hypothetical protein